MSFICASTLIKMECYMFSFIETINEYEGLTLFPIFPIDSSKSFTLLLFNFHANLSRYFLNQIILDILLFSECYY